MKILGDSTPPYRTLHRRETSLELEYEASGKTRLCGSILASKRFGIRLNGHMSVKTIWPIKSHTCWNYFVPANEGCFGDRKGCSPKMLGLIGRKQLDI